MSYSHDDTITILLGFGGSGGKTLAHLMKMMANDPRAAEIASDRLHLILCDTDEGDLERAYEDIQTAFSQSGLADPPPVERFRLADSVDLFQDLVSERMRGYSPEQRAVMRQHWWFEPSGDGQSDRPFSAGNMPENVNRGAAQCPPVSHFLAWDKLDKFEQLLEKVSAHAKNKRHLERFSVDLFVVAGLAGGTGRGSWQALSFKAREFFWQDRNGRRACRPIGFFFDASCFSNVAAQRPEQAIKLQVNSYTGLSELSMWLRSSLPIDSKIAANNISIAKERGFLLPGLKDPTDRSSAAIDTERYMPEQDEARLGRTPIHRAYVFTRHSQSLTLSDAEEAFQLAAAAIYGRIAISATRSADANEPARACATATSMLYVPIARIQQGLLRSAAARRIEKLLHGTSQGTDQPEPLTRLEGKEPVAHHRELLSDIEVASRALRGLASLGSREQFAALAGVPQVEPSVPLSVIAFAVSREGEEAITTLIDGGEKRDAVVQEVERAVQGVTPDMVRSAVARALRNEVIKPKQPIDPGLDKASSDRLLRRALFQQFVLEPVVNRALRQGIGPAYVLASRLLSVARDGHDAIAKIAASQGDRAGAGPGERAGGDEWSKPYFGFFNGIRRTQRDAFRATVRERICTRAHPHVASALHDMINGIMEDTAQLKQLLLDAVGVLDRERVRAIRDASKVQAECFTEMSDGDGKLRDQEKMLSDLEKDRSSPVSKMIRPVRPLLDRKQLDRLVDGLLGEGGSVQMAQGELSDFLAAEAQGTDRRTGRTSYEFRSQLEDRLRAVLKRQSVSFKDLQPHFNLETVLGDLMTVWFQAYRDRRGDPQFASRLDEEVRLLTGISLEEIFRSAEESQRGGASVSIDELAPPPADEVLVSASLKLAAGCDPFVQYAGDSARRDRVTVFVPNSTEQRLDRAVKQIADAWQKRSNFAHVKAVKAPDNHFMLVATSDLPKEDFTDNGWDGWFEDPSDPKVRKWLEWCEDGSAPFKTADGSVGLGYVSPQYVRNPHLNARRWKAWVNEGRSREQMHRKWVALAYALLGNQPYTSRVEAEWSGRYDDFVRVFRETFATTGSKHVPNEDFPAELWSLPLLVERPGGRGPSLTRRLFIQTAQGTRMAGMETKEIDSSCESMRKFVNWFESDESDRAVTAMLAEQSIFANMLQRTRHTADAVHTVTSAAHVEACRKFLREYASQWQAAIRDVRGLAPEERDNQVRFLERFIHFFDHGMPDLDLFQPFDGARS